MLASLGQEGQSSTAKRKGFEFGDVYNSLTKIEIYVNQSIISLLTHDKTHMLTPGNTQLLHRKKSQCLSNIEVIGQSMAEIQLLPVSENKGGPKTQK